MAAATIAQRAPGERGQVQIEPEVVRRAVSAALEEDIGPGDVTSMSLIPDDARGRGYMVVKSPGVVAGLSVAATAFTLVDPRISFEPKIRDGQRVAAGMIIADVAGPAGRILSAERTALNFVQRLSGIATLTAQAVELAGAGGPRILDTRKTTPGLRLLEKYAVRCGGGSNHRLGLYDAVLIKDNHVRVVGGAAAAVRGARAAVGPFVKIEVEVTTLDEVRAVMAAGPGGLPDVILLDNMAPPVMREAVGIIGGRAKVEASGGITLANLKEVAATGVDYISMGALTHSAKALDISLEIEIDPAAGGQE